MSKSKLVAKVLDLPSGFPKPIHERGKGLLLFLLEVDQGKSGQLV